MLGARHFLVTNLHATAGLHLSETLHTVGMHEPELQMRGLLDLCADIIHLLGFHARHLDEDAVFPLRCHEQILRAFRVQALFQDADGLLHGIRSHLLWLSLVIQTGLELHSELTAACQVHAQLDVQRLPGEPPPSVDRPDAEQRHQQGEQCAHDFFPTVLCGAQIIEKQEDEDGTPEEGDLR